MRQRPGFPLASLLVLDVERGRCRCRCSSSCHLLVPNINRRSLSTIPRLVKKKKNKTSQYDHKSSQHAQTLTLKATPISCLS